MAPHKDEEDWELSSQSLVNGHPIPDSPTISELRQRQRQRQRQLDCHDPATAQSFMIVARGIVYFGKTSLVGSRAW